MAAQTIPNGSATRAQAGGSSPTPARGAASPGNAQSVAGALPPDQPVAVETLLDDWGLSGGAQAQSSGDEASLSQAEDTEFGDDPNDVEAAGQGAYTEEEPEDPPSDPEDPELPQADLENPDPEHADPGPTDPAQAADEPKKLGRFAANVLAHLQKAGVSPALQKRIKESFVKEITQREALASREEMLQTKDAEVAALNAQLAQLGDAVTRTPAGPLAHLQTPEALAAAVSDAAHFYEWAATHPEGGAITYPSGRTEAYADDERSTVEEKLAQARSRHQAVLSHSATQSQVLEKQRSTRESLRQKAPSLFDPKHEDYSMRQGLYRGDPRQMPDFDLFIADALRGRRERLDEETGVRKYYPIDLKQAKANGAKGAAAAAANGNGNGHANGTGKDSTLSQGTPNGRAPANGRPASPAQLPAPLTASRIPARLNGDNQKQRLLKKAETEAVNAEDLIDAMG